MFLDLIVGFVCSIDGSTTDYITKVSKKLWHRDFQYFEEKLYSNKASEQFVSCIVLKILHDKNLRVLNKEEDHYINNLSKSKKSFMYCYGCADYSRITLKEGLDIKNPKRLKLDAIELFEQILTLEIPK